MKYHIILKSADDLREIHEVINLGKNKIYDFVNSPLYELFASLAIDRAVSVVAPLLGVMPLHEFRDFMKIVNRKPEIAKVIFADHGPESIVKILPNAALFDQWLSNSTKKIVDQVVESASASDDPMSSGDYMDADLLLLRSGQVKAPTPEKNSQ